MKIVATMENCEYTQVFADTGIGLLEFDRNKWQPLLRQSIICLGVFCLYFMLGMFLGAPTVIAAQIRKDVNSTEVVTDEILSWLTSSAAISSIPFVIILPLLFNRIGRKLTFLFIWLSLSIGFIFLYFSTRLYYLVLSQILVGVSFAATHTVSPVLIAEYTSPQYRGIFLTVKSASTFWGIWVSNAIGMFFPWRNIVIIPFICTIYILSMFLWPESPYWLARRGRYTESAKAHRWLKGVNEDSEKELAQLIISQKEIRNLSLPVTRNICLCISNILLILRSRSFYKPVLISIILFAQYQFSGKLVISMYAIDVLKHLTEDENFVYIEMLILDGVTVFSMYIGCILSRYYKRRTLLILFSVTGIFLLYMLSLYTYLVSLSILKENHVVVVTLLSAFSISVGCGPMILPSSIYGEIVPRRHEKMAIIIVGSYGTTTMSLLLKLSPFMFKFFNMHGSFLFFAISSTIILSIIYIHVPETKDKTIQEIKTYFTDSKLSLEPSKKLLHTEISSKLT